VHPILGVHLFSSAAIPCLLAAAKCNALMGRRQTQMNADKNRVLYSAGSSGVTAALNFYVALSP
jgi:hypothetical protein